MKPDIGSNGGFVPVSGEETGDEEAPPGLSNVPSMSLFGAVELGGTKCLVAFADTNGHLSEPDRIATTTPDETLGALIDTLQRREVTAIGVASFGPINLRKGHRLFGTMLSTPKPGWSGVNIYRRFVDRLGVPIALTTDVNAAAVSEGRSGAASGIDSFAYVTVGTGIGAGIVVAGSLIEGEHHPEMGHISVNRMKGDRHPGTCPYHGMCLEGMAAGPALEARFGPPSTWAGNESVLDVAAHYLAQGMVALVYLASPERIVVGGGVSKLPGFHDRIRTRVGHWLADYPEEPDLDLLISPPGLDEMSALAGALALAMDRSP